MDRYSVMFIAALIGAAILGCDDKKTATSDTRTPGEKVQTAADKTADVVHDGIQAAGRGLGTVVDKTTDAARAAADRTTATTNNTSDRTVTEHTVTERTVTTPVPTTQPVVQPTRAQ